MSVKRPYPGKNDQKRLIFTSNWNERTVTQRGQSISKLVRYYFTNVGNFLSLFPIYSFDHFYFIMIKKLKWIMFFCVGLNRKLACCGRSITQKTWYVLFHKNVVNLVLEKLISSQKHDNQAGSDLPEIFTLGRKRGGMDIRQLR